MPSSILKTSHLTKIYKKHSFLKTQEITGVCDLDLEVYQGEVFGFLGPNGAGKTTTLNMLVGITKPTDGTIDLFGQRFSCGQTEPLYRIGYVPETTSLPPYFTVAEILAFYADIFGIPHKIKKSRIMALLQEVQLLKVKDVLIQNLSMGQRRLLDFIQALINDPDLIFLDEPTVYLDPIAMEYFRKILENLKAKGKTIFISSQALSEIQRLSDRVAIIDEGQLLKIAPKEDYIQNTTMEEEFLKIIKSRHAS